MLETILGIYLGSAIISFLLLTKFAGNSATASDLFVSATLWPLTLFTWLFTWLKH